MKLTATSVSQTIEQLILSKYWQDILSKVSRNRWNHINFIVSNVAQDQYQIFFEKFEIPATITDSEPINIWESRSFSNINLRQYSVIAPINWIDFYLT